LIDYGVEGRHCNQGLARYIAVSARVAEETKKKQKVKTQ